MQRDNVQCADFGFFLLGIFIFLKNIDSIVNYNYYDKPVHHQIDQEDPRTAVPLGGQVRGQLTRTSSDRDKPVHHQHHLEVFPSKATLASSVIPGLKLTK